MPFYLVELNKIKTSEIHKQKSHIKMTYFIQVFNQFFLKGDSLFFLKLFFLNCFLIGAFRVF